MKPSNITLFFTGGGSAGHCLPNVPLINTFQKRGLTIGYIGTSSGKEETWLDGKVPHFFQISTGKLRRYWSIQNITDLFRIIKGVWQSFWIIRNHKPRVVFSKGGFVAVPVVISAWLNRVPIVIHESDLTAGLANRICAKFADHLCTAFQDTLDAFSTPSLKTHTGIPLRSTFYAPSAKLPASFPAPHPSKPRLVIFGGSLGAEPINQFIFNHIKELTDQFQIIHIIGPKIKTPLQHIDYHPYPNIHEHFPNVLFSAQLILCRSGANTLYELITLQCPHILVPLPKYASRGDQIHNANWAAQKGLSGVIPQDQLQLNIFRDLANKILRESNQYREKMAAEKLPNSHNILISILDSYLDAKKHL